MSYVTINKMDVDNDSDLALILYYYLIKSQNAMALAQSCIIVFMGDLGKHGRPKLF